jgi:hypothetical protein
MAMSFEQLLERLRTSGVSNDALSKLTEMSNTAIANSFQADTTTAAKTKAYFDKVTTALEGYRKDLSDTVDVDQELLDSYEEEMDILRSIMDNEAEAGRMGSDRLNAAQKRYKELAKLRKAKKGFLEGMDKGEAAAEQLLQATFGLSTEWGNLSAGGFAKGFGLGTMKMLKGMNLITSLVQKIIERALDYDKASADLFKKTGIDKSKLNLKKMATGLKGMSIDLQQKLVGSITDLQDGFRSIGDLGVDQLEATAQTITILEGFGASNRDTVATFGILTKTLGKTPEQANEFLNNTTALAESIARPPAELLSDFVKAAPVLARFGNQSEKVFKDISLQATLLEMDVAQLVGLSEGMDTFEGAAKAAQSFNIAVGQPFLSAQALLSADPAKKLQLIADAYERAGNVDLSARMRRGLAADMGVNPAELERILNLNSSELGTKRDEMDVAQASVMENIASITKNQTAMDKITAQMQRIVDSLVDATSLDEGLGKVASLLTSVAVALTRDEDLERTHAAKLKIAKEGGLVNLGGETFVGDSRYYTKQNVSDARSKMLSGDSLSMHDSGLKDFLTKKTESGHTPLQMTNSQYKDYMSKYATTTLGGDARITEASAARNSASESSVFFTTLAGAVAGAKVGGVSTALAGSIVPGAGTAVGGIIGTVVGFIGGGITGYKVGQELEESDMARGAGGTGYVLQNDAMATPMSVGSNYVQPVFNKQDKFYAAKDGGAIANALDEVLAAVDKLIEEKRDVNLDISERKLAQAVDGAFAGMQRRTV